MEPSSLLMSSTVALKTTDVERYGHKMAAFIAQIDALIDRVDTEYRETEEGTFKFVTLSTELLLRLPGIQGVVANMEELIQEVIESRAYRNWDIKYDQKVGLIFNLGRYYGPRK
jgi:hypothetical protein